MKKLADYGTDDHPPDDPERAQAAWAVALLDDREACADLRVEGHVWRKRARPAGGSSPIFPRPPPAGCGPPSRLRYGKWASRPTADRRRAGQALTAGRPSSVGDDLGVSPQSGELDGDPERLGRPAVEDAVQGRQASE
ncbi:MAG: hypothetical protein WKG07_45835 [Hymenobacter sp.]